MPNILKAGAVTVDNEKVNIEVGPVAAVYIPEASFVPEAEEEESPEEKAHHILQKAEHDADQLRRKAAGEAASIIEDAKKQATAESQAIKEQARSDGYQEGLQKATSEGEAIKAQANKVLEDARRERAETEASLEPDMVDLINKIVAKLLDDTIRINPGVIINLIRQGLAGATLTGNIFVHVSQYDFEEVTENKEALLAMTDGSVKLEIIRDLSLNRMDCVIETPFGNIDCSLTQQSDALRENLNYILWNK